MSDTKLKPFSRWSSRKWAAPSRPAQVGFTGEPGSRCPRDCRMTRI